MSEFADVLSKLDINPRRLIERSAVLERQRAAGQRRWRGLSGGLVAKAMRGEDLPRRVRAKLARALRDLAPGASLPWERKTSGGTAARVVPAAASETIAPPTPAA